MAKRTRDADYPPPHRVSDEHFQDLCRGCDIERPRWATLRTLLDEIVEELSDYIRRGTSSIRDDRETIEEALHRLDDLQETVAKRVGPAGRRAMRSIGPKLGPAVAASWLREAFPEDPSTPGQHVPPVRDRFGRLPQREPMRAERFDIEEESLEGRIDFVARRPLQTTSTILAHLKAGLSAALEALPKTQGGGEAIERRGYALWLLAQVWHRCTGLRHTDDPGRFDNFVARTFIAVGWPTTGLDRARRKALKAHE